MSSSTFELNGFTICIELDDYNAYPLVPGPMDRVRFFDRATDTNSRAFNENAHKDGFTHFVLIDAIEHSGTTWVRCGSDTWDTQRERGALLFKHEPTDEDIQMAIDSLNESRLNWLCTVEDWRGDTVEAFDVMFDFDNAVNESIDAAAGAAIEFQHLALAEIEDELDAVEQVLREHAIGTLAHCKAMMRAHALQEEYFDIAANDYVL